MTGIPHRSSLTSTSTVATASQVSSDLINAVARDLVAIDAGLQSATVPVIQVTSTLETIGRTVGLPLAARSRSWC